MGGSIDIENVTNQFIGVRVIVTSNYSTVTDLAKFLG